MIKFYINIKQELNILKERKKLLDFEKDIIDKLIIKKEDSLNIIDNHLKELKGIENKLYYQIVVLGKSVTKAVDKVAFDEYKDVSTIWKNYYPNVKKKLKELETLANNK